MAMFFSHAERDRAEDVRGEPLLSVLLLGGLVPVGGGEIEDVAAGPAGQQTQEVAQVGGLKPRARPGLAGPTAQRQAGRAA